MGKGDNEKMTHPELIIDFIAVALLLYGFVNEDKLIRFEQNLKRIIKGNFKRFMRIRKQRKTVKTK